MSEKTKIMLTQDAYIEGNGNEEWYQAMAVDAEGNEYNVYWDIREGYDPELQDEESACDWDSPSRIQDLDRWLDDDNVTDETVIVDDVMTDLYILTLDGCTKKEADRYLKNGTTVFDGEDFESNAESYMEQLATDDEERKEFQTMIETKQPATDWGVVERYGRIWYIMYVN